jgi:hypothetical protein
MVAVVKVETAVTEAEVMRGKLKSSWEWSEQRQQRQKGLSRAKDEKLGALVTGIVLESSQTLRVQGLRHLEPETLATVKAWGSGHLRPESSNTCHCRAEGSSSQGLNTSC